MHEIISTTNIICSEAINAQTPTYSFLLYITLKWMSSASISESFVSRAEKESHV